MSEIFYSIILTQKVESSPRLRDSSQNIPKQKTLIHHHHNHHLHFHEHVQYAHDKSQ